MAQRFRELVSTPHVLSAQKAYFGQARVPAASGVEKDALTLDEAAFIATRDSFYMSTVSETGWPYLQHRGGAPGFLKVLSLSQIAFADYKGNRQLLSTGNLSTNDKVCLFLMDYPHQERLKILGQARVLDAREHPELVAKVADPAMARTTERIFIVDIVSYDWNCPQYITPRYTESEIKELVTPLQNRIKELEAQLSARS